MSRSASFARVTAAYVIAIVAGAIWLIFGPSMAPWLSALIADLIATLVVFVASRLHRNSSFYDPFWSVAPPLLVVYWWIAGENGLDAWWCWVLLTVVSLWAVRLTWNWVMSFPGLHHEDWRYPMLKESAGRWEALVDLSAIHLIPTAQVFLGMTPVYVAVSDASVTVPWLVAVAAAVGVLAVVLELVADGQLRRFTRDHDAGQTITTGLWAWSRHPNYFGEFLFWVSLLLFGVAVAPAQSWWMWIGAAAMLALFVGASIPMMEQRSVERRPGYVEAVSGISRFIPWAPRRLAAP